MNLDIFKPLAQRLASNPGYLAESEEAALRELLLHHSQKLLDAELSREVEEMILTNPLAGSIWREFQASDEYLQTEAGRDWLQSAGQRILSNVLASRASVLPSLPVSPQPPPTPTPFLETLASAIAEIFVVRATLATASGDEGLVRTLDDGQTRIVLKSDSAGRLWLRVTSKVRTGSFKFDVEPAPPILTFSEIEPGLYSARICVDAELAAALEKGVPKLTPLPPGKS